MRRRRQSLVRIAPLLLLTGCAVNPATGERQLIFQSQAQEVEMGREADAQVTAAYGVVDDQGLQDYVADLGRRLAATTHPDYQDLPWTFRVVDDATVNAFALPGGFIYVTRGILARFDSEAELAGVVGHEIGHVTARHSANQMSRQQLMQIGLGVGMVLSETVREYGQLGALGLQVLSLRYSRGDETQADELGLKYMSGLGYDPDAMIGVFEMLAQVSGGAADRLPEWQLTHPYPENREAHMRELIEKERLPHSGTIGHDELLDAIDGIVYGENPREGYFEGERFLHPEMAFELTFPSGWTTVNQKTMVGAAAPKEDAVITLQVADDAGAPNQALADFLRQEGITAGQARQGSSGGIEMARAPFEATTENGVYRGEVAFARHRGVTFRLMGYSTASGWSGYQGAVSASISSFAEVTDPSVLGVEPRRLDIVTMPESMSIASYHQRFGSAIPVEELAALNRRTPDEVVNRGERIKNVVGPPKR